MFVEIVDSKIWVVELTRVIISRNRCGNTITLQGCWSQPRSEVRFLWALLLIKQSSLRFGRPAPRWFPNLPIYLQRATAACGVQYLPWGARYLAPGGSDLHRGGGSVQNRQRAVVIGTYHSQDVAKIAQHLQVAFS